MLPCPVLGVWCKQLHLSGYDEPWTATTFATSSEIPSPHKADSATSHCFRFSFSCHHLCPQRKNKFLKSVDRPATKKLQIEQRHGWWWTHWKMFMAVWMNWAHAHLNAWGQLLHPNTSTIKPIFCHVPPHWTGRLQNQPGRNNVIKIHERSYWSHNYFNRGDVMTQVLLPVYICKVKLFRL